MRIRAFCLCGDVSAQNGIAAGMQANLVLHAFFASAEPGCQSPSVTEPRLFGTSDVRSVGGERKIQMKKGCPARSSGRPLLPSPSFHSGFDCAQDDTRCRCGEGILCLLPSPSATPPPLPEGEQRENATVRRFLEAKSSPQGVEGEGYAPTRNDYVAGQGGYGTTAFATLSLPP